VATDEAARAIERAQKLLRLAAPDSGTTDAERSNAALLAAKLIAEHKLVVAAAPEPIFKKRRSPKQPQARATTTWARWSAPAVPSVDWTEVRVPQRCDCAVCGNTLWAGEAAWFDPSQGCFRHYDITCDQ